MAIGTICKMLTMKDVSKKRVVHMNAKCTTYAWKKKLTINAELRDTRSNCLVQREICERRICKNYGSISLLSIPGKFYGKLVINRERERINGTIEEIQSSLWESICCADKIFNVWWSSEKYIEKQGNKLCIMYMCLL